MCFTKIFLILISSCLFSKTAFKISLAGCCDEDDVEAIDVNIGTSIGVVAKVIKVGDGCGSRLAVIDVDGGIAVVVSGVKVVWVGDANEYGSGFAIIDVDGGLTLTSAGIKMIRSGEQLRSGSVSSLIKSFSSANKESSSIILVGTIISSGLIFNWLTRNIKKKKLMLWV